MQTTTIEKTARTRVPIADVLRTRWSPRAFTNRPVENKNLLALLEAARWSPSSMNEQPWHFMLAAKHDDPEAYRQLYKCLSKSNQRWVHRAPVLLLAAAKLHNARTGEPNVFAWYDVGQSVAFLTVQATALGLAVHQLGGFDRGKAREIIRLPDGYEPIVMLCIGYADSPEVLPDDLRVREEAPRFRKPLESFVFTEEWGNPSHHINSIPSTASN